ncbi:RNA polymerase sigma factor [Stieleria neptunia]|uniref:RNA polymerase sigma factor n=1 Tax=Stieleria neptunia TaxID=2527979 RepID=A0A518HRC0_9BACT|nr:ECF-type sigma factor [Stieleria neptunia]QDV43402.1 RNA polymerase sigma factor [Stieleria neptunia]
MDEMGSVSIWVQQLPDDEREAQSKIFERYQAQLVQYAANRLRQMGVRSKDADDIAQEVFLGLFCRSAAGKMPDLNNRDQLWLKLRRICGDRVKDARRRRTLATESVFGLGESQSSLSPLQANLRPSEDLESCLIAVEHSLLKRKMEEKHPDLPVIASLKMQGYTVSEIASKIDAPKRTIERRLRSIDEICRQYQQAEPEAT